MISAVMERERKNKMTKLEYDTNSTSGAEKYCPLCNTRLEMAMGNNCWECPSCGYGYIDYIGDPPKDNFFVPCDNAWGVGYAHGKGLMELDEFVITNCEKIKMHHKEMDIDFEFDTKKIENINTIIINGHKFVRET